MWLCGGIEHPVICSVPWSQGGQSVLGGSWVVIGQSVLGGSWVVISKVIRRVISKVTILLAHNRGLITPLITTHEPPSGARV